MMYGLDREMPDGFTDFASLPNAGELAELDRKIEEIYERLTALAQSGKDRSEEATELREQLLELDARWVEVDRARRIPMRPPGPPVDELLRETRHLLDRHASPTLSNPTP